MASDRNAGNNEIITDQESKLTTDIDEIENYYKYKDEYDKEENRNTEKGSSLKKITNEEDEFGT